MTIWCNNCLLFFHRSYCDFIFNLCGLLPHWDGFGSNKYQVSWEIQPHHHDPSRRASISTIWEHPAKIKANGHAVQKLTFCYHMSSWGSLESSFNLTPKLRNCLKLQKRMPFASFLIRNFTHAPSIFGKEILLGIIFIPIEFDSMCIVLPIHLPLLRVINTSNFAIWERIN